MALKGHGSGESRKLIEKKRQLDFDYSVTHTIKVNPGGIKLQQKSRQAQGQAAFSERCSDQAVSPSTDTVTSTTTSVCKATATEDSLTVLIGPMGIRICDLSSL